MALFERGENSELVIALVGAVGTDLKRVSFHIKDRLELFEYKVHEIRVADKMIKGYYERLDRHDDNEGDNEGESSAFMRLKNLMDHGNVCRKEARGKNKQNNWKGGANDILACGAVNEICEKRKGATKERQAYIIHSLKRPEEVELLRHVYGNGFYLFGVYSDEEMRRNNLINRGMKEEKANELMKQDEDDKSSDYGQQTNATFQLSDFFIDYNGNDIMIRNSIRRIIDLLFGHPHMTPTFGEYAMFHAYSASLRSADLSRQIGAVVCRDNEILAYGANDCPKPGGGLYWMEVNKENNYEYKDAEGGRDYTTDYEKDPNKDEIEKIAQDMAERALSCCKTGATEEEEKELLRQIAEKLMKRDGRLNEISEYGRTAHAEMEALTMCARNNISCRGAKMYVTTFPCHMCTKLIIPSGITEVVYIQPYPKSKSFDMYKKQITRDPNDHKKTGKVLYTPFFGVGPTRFMELFSMIFGDLYQRVRKDKDNNDTIIKDWIPNGEKYLRNQIETCSYKEKEEKASIEWEKAPAQLSNIPMPVSHKLPRKKCDNIEHEFDAVQ